MGSLQNHKIGCAYKTCSHRPAQFMKITSQKGTIPLVYAPLCRNWYRRWMGGLATSLAMYVFMGNNNLMCMVLTMNIIQNT